MTRPGAVRDSLLAKMLKAAEEPEPGKARCVFCSNVLKIPKRPSSWMKRRKPRCCPECRDLNLTVYRRTLQTEVEQVLARRLRALAASNLRKLAATLPRD